MLPYLIWSLLLVLSCNAFQYSYLYCGVSRVFAGLRKAVVEASVGDAPSYSNEKYVIDVESLRENCIEYFTLNLEPYCKRKDWSVSCYKELIIKNGLIKQNAPITIDLKVNLHSFGTYENTMRFEIRKGMMYGS